MAIAGMAMMRLASYPMTPLSALTVAAVFAGATE